MASDPRTLERVRRILSSRKDVVEKPLVGGSRGLMVKGKLCVSVGVDRILVRVAKEERPKLLKKPGARPMKMGGKTMSGFIFIDPIGYHTEVQLKGWIQQSLDVIESLSAKTKAGAGHKK